MTERSTKTIFMTEFCPKHLRERTPGVQTLMLKMLKNYQYRCGKTYIQQNKLKGHQVSFSFTLKVILILSIGKIYLQYLFFYVN